MPTRAELVRGYRAIIESDPGKYSGDVDVAYWLVDDTPERDWTPSQIAQAVGITTSAAQAILADLGARGHIAHDDRGAWTHYWSRRR